MQKVVQEGERKGQLKRRGEGKYVSREGEEQRRKRRKIFGLSCQGEGKREERRGSFWKMKMNGEFQNQSAQEE